jgi:hypothetical protein
MAVNTNVSLRLDCDKRCLYLGLNGLWREEVVLGRSRLRFRLFCLVLRLFSAFFDCLLFKARNLI